MKMQMPLLLLLYLFSCLQSFSQHGANQKDFFYYELYQAPQHVYTLVDDKKQVNPKQTITYQNQGEWHSEYLYLNPDSTFKWVSYYEVGNNFSFGYWSKANDSTLILNWNAELTNQLLQNKTMLEQYNIRPTTIPLRIKNWLLIQKKDSLFTKVYFPDKNGRKIYIDSLATEMDNKVHLLQVDTVGQFNPSGYTVGYSIDSIYFDSNFTLVKLIRTGKNFRSTYYFLPTNLYKVIHQDSNLSITPSIYYFDDQMLVDTIGVTKFDNVKSEHYLVTTWKYLLIFGKKNKY